MIGQASHLPVHLGSTPLSVQAAIEAVDMRPGDAVCLNDPYAGGTHLPDITLVSPVFLPGSSGARPDFYCANRAHHADVGGAAPGSMAPARDVHGEGLRIPPVRLVHGGKLVQDVLALFLANMRVPSEREGDLLAQWSTNRIGERRLRELAQEHGPKEVRQRAQDLMDWTERLTRELLSSLSDGVWSFEDELEDGAADETAEPARVRVRLEKRADRLVCDLTETDARPASSLNATRAVTVSAVFYVLRLFLPRFAPANDGLLRPVEIVTRAGTLVDAAYPSGVAAGNVETSQRIVDALLGAFARALPERVPAASAGTMSNLTFGGPLPSAPSESRAAEGIADSPEPFAYYETIAGGAGAGPAGHGAHALQTHMTNTRNTPIESFEASYPVRVLALQLRRRSGGAGQARGGDGIAKRLRFLEAVHVSFVAERQRRGPWGLCGGAPGDPGGLRLKESARTAWQRKTGRFARRVDAGSELEILTPGGGGYGPQKPGQRSR